MRGKKASDLILLSPTGSGKTLAYLLPLVSSLKKGVEGVQAVVLVPSRELALQIEQVFKAMATGFPVMSCYGGRPAMEEHRTMKGISPAVIIGTPGRMNDHLNKQNFEAGTVRTLVIDEFDKCLEFGFQDEMAEVIGKLPSLRRRFLLSATDAEEIPRFTGDEPHAEAGFPGSGGDGIAAVEALPGHLAGEGQAGDALQAAVYAGQRIDAGVLQPPGECGPGREVPALHEGVLRDVPRRHGAGRPRTGVV